MHILVLIHSQGGSCLMLSEQAQRGVESVPGMTAQLKRVLQVAKVALWLDPKQLQV